MSQFQYAWLINAACTVAWLMVMLPALLFLKRSWSGRRDALLDLMTEDVLELYYARFFPSRRIATGQFKTTFRRDFGRRYGRRWYLAPLILMGATAALGLWGTAGTLKIWTGLTRSQGGTAMPDIAVGAFLGGMTWVLADQFTRLRTRDFTSHDVYNAVFRLLISIPLGCSLASFGDSKLKVTIAYLLGTFPTNTLFSIARRLGSQKLGIADDTSAETGSSELEQLQCVGKATAERIRDEGVASIAALAWADPIDLTIRTNLEFGFVVDCISQALLWIYVGKDGRSLFVLSLRGAQEVVSFLRDYNSTDQAESEEAKKTLAEAAARLKGDPPLSPEALHQTLLQVAGDPSTKFLSKIWEAQSGKK